MDANQLSQLLMQNSGTSQNQLNQRAQLANMLLQSGQKTSSPIVAALAGFLGTNELQNIADQQGAVDKTAAEKEAAKDIYNMQYKERAFEEDKRQFNEQMKQNAQQFAAKIGLEREKFNAEAIRDARNNAITKIADPKTGTDLLFQGLKPLTEGLEKGMQWGIGKDGNRVAVPIPQVQSEKASAQKDLALQTVNRLLNNKSGVLSIYGALDRITPNITEAARNAETDINMLSSLLTVENLGLLKGVLSDTDIKILQRVGAGEIALDTASQGGAWDALNRMQLVLSDRSFSSESAAESSGLPKGTRVLINGRIAEID